MRHSKMKTISQDLMTEIQAYHLTTKEIQLNHIHPLNIYPQASHILPLSNSPPYSQPYPPFPPLKTNLLSFPLFLFTPKTKNGPRTGMALRFNTSIDATVSIPALDRNETSGEAASVALFLLSSPGWHLCILLPFLL